MSSQTAELPRSLQELIADAQRSHENWESEPASKPDELFDGEHEWTARLARGEYEQDLYWECVAEDRERAGDWSGAIAAYKKVVRLTKSGDVKRMEAHSGLALLYSLLGQRRRATNCYRLAAEDQVGECSSIFFRICICAAVRDDVCHGRIRRARRQLARGFASFEERCQDDLGYAKLQITSAECDVATGNVAGAEESLLAAWDALEQMVEWMKPSIEETGPASGLEAALAEWWTVEARRRRLGSEPASELEGWQKALQHRRRGCEGWDNLAWNFAVEKTLEKLADACVRAGDSEAAAATRAEANAIRVRWHLPEDIALDQRAAGRWSLGRLFRRGE
jgi:tetratricopeptide (TPR) repeat protein